MDWQLCVICCEGSGTLKCPAESHQKNGLEVYTTFLENAREFREIGALPVELNFGCEGTADIFLTNQAKWHKSCHLKFASSKLSRAKQRKRKISDDGNMDRRQSKRQALCAPLSLDVCIFCMESSGKLHQCATMNLDKALRRMATELQDTSLLARISGGDLVAIEAKYHYDCMSTYKNRHRSMQRKARSSASNNEEMMVEVRAFAELVSYIEGSVEDGSYLFKLTELHKLYESRLQDLGVVKSINKSRLKTRLLGHFLDQCQEQTDGKNTLLVFNEGLRKLLGEALISRDYEAEALSIAKTAKHVRQEIFDKECFRFTGSFPPDCQRESVPTALKSLVSMLLNGPNLKNQDKTDSQVCLTISQFILFNVKNKSPTAVNTRHSEAREPPLPLYLGMNIHTLTRSKKIMNQLYKLGISVSYDRIIQVENWLATAACRRAVDDDLVCPVHLRKGLFTVGALDNIDYNPSSTTAQGSFHGTGISIFQFPTTASPGIGRDPLHVPPESIDKKPSLPDSYCIVPAVACNIEGLAVPKARTMQSIANIEGAKALEEMWIEEAIQLLDKDNLEKDDCIAWSTFHSSLQPEPMDPVAIIALLPLFYEKAATLAMVKHGMEIQKQITNHLNPGQIPVTAFDQPLFALAKYVQWKWPLTHGEQTHVVMLGGLHIEMALWNTIGDLLESSGWTTALCEAGVATSGTADSFLKASHLTRTRHGHQVTVLALHKLQRDAFQTLDGYDDDENAFESWRIEMTNSSPTFQFWDIIMRFEMLVLIFIRAHRECDFLLYVKALESLVPWFFALDHNNYSRWLPIHIRDMQSLPEAIIEDFHKFWVLPKTRKKFSCMPLDQGHEQNNELIKGSGGTVGLTENPVAFRRWMVAGPEQAKLIEDFNSQYLDSEDVSSQHHEGGLASQETFRRQANSLCETITDMGNPFLDNFQELLVLDTRNCSSDAVADTVRSIEKLGSSQYQAYVKDVIEDRTVSIHQPIKKNCLPLFKKLQPKPKSKGKQQMTSLKSDCNLFSHLYIASQARGGDLEEFFLHENHPWPPSISDHGKLRLPTKKSELLACLDVNTPPTEPSRFDAKIFDGATVVHALPINQASTFDEYGGMVFLPWMEQQLQSCDRVDVVWDSYRPDSLKESTREKRGTGLRRKVTGKTKLPRNFPNFLRDSTNKEELFAFLTQKVSTHRFPENKEVYITSGISEFSSITHVFLCSQMFNGL